MSERELWVEKYRPRHIDDLIAPKKVIDKFRQYIDEKQIPHLLFHGSAGLGKSTVAKILANTITTESLYINASDETSVETIRTKVKDFCSTMCFSDDLKIVILDEFDGMSDHAMKMLRNTMEEFHNTCRFILTCNYVTKIIDPIRSRCQEFEFGNVTRKDIAVRCAKILKEENVTYNDKKDIAFLVSSFYPDIRRIINNLQKNCNDGVFNFVEEVADKDDKDRLIELIKEGDIKIIRKELLGPGADYVGYYRALFNRAKELIPDSDKTVEVMLIISEYFYRHSTVLDKEINFVACILSIWKMV